MVDKVHYDLCENSEWSWQCAANLGGVCLYFTCTIHTTWWDVTTLNNLFTSTVYCAYLSQCTVEPRSYGHQWPKKIWPYLRGFFFYKKMNGGFSQATKKSGRTNEVIVRRGFIVFFTWVTCLPSNLGRKISLQKLPKFFGWPKRIKCVYPEILFQSLAY